MENTDIDIIASWHGSIGKGKNVNHHHRSHSWVMNLSECTTPSSSGYVDNSRITATLEPNSGRLARVKEEWRRNSKDRTSTGHHRSHHLHRRVHSSPSLLSSSSHPHLPAYHHHGQHFSSSDDEHEKMIVKDDSHENRQLDCSVKGGNDNNDMEELDKIGGEEYMINHVRLMKDENSGHHRQASSSSTICPDSSSSSLRATRKVDHPPGHSSMPSTTSSRAASFTTSNTPSATYSPASPSSSSASSSILPCASTRHLGTPDELFEKLRASLDPSSTESNGKNKDGRIRASKSSSRTTRSRTGVNTPLSHTSSHSHYHHADRNGQRHNKPIATSLPSSKMHSQTSSGATSPRTPSQASSAHSNYNNASSRRGSHPTLPSLSPSSSTLASSATSSPPETPKAILPPPLSRSTPLHKRNSSSSTPATSASNSLITFDQAMSVSLYILVTLVASLALVSILMSSYGLTIADDVRLKIGILGRKADQQGRRIALELSEWVKNTNEQIKKRKTALEQGAKKSRPTSRRPSFADANSTTFQKEDLRSSQSGSAAHTVRSEHNYELHHNSKSQHGVWVS